MPKPSISIEVAIRQLTTSWQGDEPEAFARRIWDQSTVTYFISQFAPVTDSLRDESDGWTGMDELQVIAAQNAFSIWDELIDLTALVRVFSPDDADITFAYSTTTEKGGTYATPQIGDKISNLGPGTYRIDEQDIWFNADDARFQPDDFGFGTEGSAAYLHEIGHTLGLSHPGRYDAADKPPPTYDADAEFANDTVQYTIMSYFGGYEVGKGWVPVADKGYSPKGTILYPSTPMLYDIAAIQSLYLADTQTRTGDTTYGYSASGAEWEFFDFTKNTRPIFTIYDAGGTDAIDASLFADAQTISLVPGTYSSLLGMIDNVAVYFSGPSGSMLIENGFGGAGNDTIIGNEGANVLQGNGGNDEIFGGFGNDVLSGGPGEDLLDGGRNDGLFGVDLLTGGTEEDTFVYARGYRLTTITDYDTRDVLDLTATRVHSFTELLQIARQEGPDVVFDFGPVGTPPGDVLTLRDFTLDDLDPETIRFSDSDVPVPGDFLLVPNPETIFTAHRIYTGALQDGGFLVVEDTAATYRQSALMARVFDARGVEVSAVQVNTTPFGNSGLDVETATLTGGNVVVAWESAGSGLDGRGEIRARIFGPDGIPLGDDFVVNSVPAVIQNDGLIGLNLLDVEARQTGGFVVKWTADTTPGFTQFQDSFRERGFLSSGEPVQGDTDFGAFDGIPPDPVLPPRTTDPVITSLGEGRNLRTWIDTSPDNPGGPRHFFAEIIGETNPMQLDQGMVFDAQAYGITVLTDGRILFTWPAGGQFGFSTAWNGGQVLIADGDLMGFTRPGTAGDDLLQGGGYNDRLYGLQGNDTLIGMAGPDILDGGDGVDLVDYDRSTARVLVDLTSSGPQSGGHAEGDVLNGIENLRGSAYGDILKGTDGVNRIVGGHGGDDIFGYGGDDALFGDRGFDQANYAGPVDSYAITFDPATDTFTLTDLRPGSPDGTDTATGFERFYFSNDSYNRDELIERIAGTPDQPVAPVADVYDVTPGEVLTVAAAEGVLANDAAPDGGASVRSLIERGDEVGELLFTDSGGVLFLSSDGSFSYFPAPGFIGEETVTYRMRDADGSTGDATITFRVGSTGNLGVMPLADVYGTPSGQTLTVTAAAGVLANDAAPDGGAVVLGLLYDGELVGGTLFTEVGSQITIAPDGSISYVPGAGFTGQEIVTYRMRDADGSFADAAVTFRVEPAAPPVNIVLGTPGQAFLQGGDGTDALVFNSTRSTQAFGGDGADVFVFLRAGDGNRDMGYIRDFEQGVDLIDVSDTTFTTRVVGTDTVIRFGASDRDTLIVSDVELTAADFTTEWSDRDLGLIA